MLRVWPNATPTERARAASATKSLAHQQHHRCLLCHLILIQMKWMF